jgi:hypothetical protein
MTDGDKLIIAILGSDDWSSTLGMKLRVLMIGFELCRLGGRVVILIDVLGVRLVVVGFPLSFVLGVRLSELGL